MTTHTTVKPFSRTWSGWSGVLGIIAGLWLIIAPFLFKFDGGTLVGQNAILTGAALGIFSAVSTFGYGHLRQATVRVFGWLAALAGLWAVISTFALNYGLWSASFFVMLITGALSAIIAAYVTYKSPSA